MIYILISIFTLFCFVFPKSKIISLGGFVLLWILWGWNSWNGDYESYEEIYYSIGSYGLDVSTFEKGYKFFNSIIFGLGFEYQSFMIIYSFIILTIIYFFVRQSTYSALFTLFYFIIFIMSYVFLRNYFADALFLHFVLLSYNLKNSKKRNVIISILLFTIAFFFHSTALLFFVFLLVYFEKLNTKRLLFLILALVILLFSSVGVFLSIFSDVSITSKIQHYQSDVNPIGPALSHLIIALIPTLFTHLNQKLDFDFRQKYLIYMFQRINIISLIYIPLYFVIPDFSRFFKLLFTLNIFFLLELFVIYKSSKERFILISIFIGIYMILLYQFSFSTLEFTLIPLFDSNLIFTK